jgi:type IV secretion system protein VirB10
MTAQSPLGNVTSPVARAPMSRLRKGLLLLSGAVVAAGITWLTSEGDKVDRTLPDRQIRPEAVGEIGSPFVPIPREAPPAPPVVPTPVAARPPAHAVPVPNSGWQLPSLAPLARPAVAISQFQASAAPAQPATTPVATGGQQDKARAGAGEGDALNVRLNAGEDAGTAVTTLLPDRNLFMTMGTPIACVTEQPIRTDVPGPFRCKVPTPVYSTSGAVPLLDPGTWVFGRIAESLERGSTRAFGVVTRLETPQGCLIKLRAPIGDQLGTSGIDGEIDTHFFERFQGVALLALLDAAGQAAALAASNAVGNGTGVQFNQFQLGGRQLGEGSFGDDVNIPSTLATHQARNIVVMAMQDIDMRACFRLRAVK